jgi:hypothetical protein
MLVRCIPGDAPLDVSLIYAVVSLVVAEDIQLGNWS